MTEIERTRAKIAEVKAKLAAAEPMSVEYYRRVLRGWEAYLAKITKEAAHARSQPPD
jgi:hypothetical protein